MNVDMRKYYMIVLNECWHQQ